ncbi:hypothetical protein L1987_39989 [Smallanthus sonchifolius]|uniref:Uncharacterized protein n=1 Tax=Smallanthus sonchifolius TaxID=185202 RepID=A0ACB9GSF9_9ASTR|nr:hypothetical protein L1987_39989 [Smallanthus sonchifolius]
MTSIPSPSIVTSIITLIGCDHHHDLNPFTLNRDVDHNLNRLWSVFKVPAVKEVQQILQLDHLRLQNNQNSFAVSLSNATIIFAR